MALPVSPLAYTCIVFLSYHDFFFRSLIAHVPDTDSHLQVFFFTTYCM